MGTPCHPRNVGKWWKQTNGGVTTTQNGQDESQIDHWAPGRRGPTRTVGSEANTTQLSHRTRTDDMPTHQNDRKTAWWNGSPYHSLQGSPEGDQAYGPGTHMGHHVREDGPWLIRWTEAWRNRTDAPEARNEGHTGVAPHSSDGRASHAQKASWCGR